MKQLGTAQRISRIAHQDIFIMSLGLGLLLFWLHQAPLLACEKAPARLSFLLLFGLSCAILSASNLPGPGRFTRGIWALPCLAALLFLPAASLRIPLSALAAFASALLVCRWYTLFARFTPPLFVLLHALTALLSVVEDLLPFPTPSKAFVATLPFLATGLLLLATRSLPWLPEGEDYPFASPPPSLLLKLFLFALLLNGSELLRRAGLSAPPLTYAKNAAWVLFPGGLALFFLMKGTIGYKRLMTLSMLSWAMGGALAGLSPGMGLFFIEGGCALFELAFWLLILRLSSGSPNPARLVCAGLALLTLALLSSHALLQAFAPLEPSGTFGFNARVALLIGLTATLSFFLPALRTKPTLIPPEVSRPPAPTPEAINTLPTPRSPEVPEVREMFLKSRLEALGLTRQECRVALMLLAEEKDTDICEALFISKNTLKFHIRNLNRKLGVANRLELPDLAERLLSDLSAPPQAVIERTGGA